MPCHSIPQPGKNRTYIAPACPPNGDCVTNSVPNSLTQVNSTASSQSSVNW